MKRFSVFLGALMVCCLLAIVLLSPAVQTPNPAPLIKQKHKRAMNIPKARAGVFMAAAAQLSALDDGAFLREADQFLKDRSREIREQHRAEGHVNRSPLGAVVSYDIFQGDLKIVGMRIDVHLDPRMHITKVEWNYRPIERVEIEETGKQLFESVSGKIPPGFRLRKDGIGFSEIIFESYHDGHGEHAVVVPVTNLVGIPMNIVVRAEDGALLSADMPRHERVKSR